MHKIFSDNLFFFYFNCQVSISQIFERQNIIDKKNIFEDFLAILNST